MLFFVARISVAAPSASETRLAVRSSLVAKDMLPHHRAVEPFVLFSDVTRFAREHFHAMGAAIDLVTSI